MIIYNAYIYIIHMYTYVYYIDAIGRHIVRLLYIRATVYVLLPFVYDVYACDVYV